MRFAENNRISHRQLYRQMILALLAPFMPAFSEKGWNERDQCSGGNDFALILLGFYVIWLMADTFI